VWFIPGEGIPISKGEEVHLHAVHSDTSVSYNLATQATEIRECDSIAGDSHLTLSPERIAIYGDRKWRSCMLTALNNLVRALWLSLWSHFQCLSFLKCKLHFAVAGKSSPTMCCCG
jgi:protein arginine N-methyltransferase 7